MPHPDLGRIRPATLPVWTLGEFLDPPKSGAKAEWLSRTGLTSHTRNYAERPRLTDTLHRCHIKFHPVMVGNDSGGPEGGP